MASRVTRANGEASRLRILESALEIAGERGYSGTSISEVSKRSGLPNSSIYWHFKDKDALFAAVIDHSYELWRADFDTRARTPVQSPGESVEALQESLSQFPAFLRFGQLMVLEQHENELGARSAFLRIRKQALVDLAANFTRMTGCDPTTARNLASLALAMVDGAFLARAAGERNPGSKGFMAQMFDACVREAIGSEVGMTAGARSGARAGARAAR